MVKFGTGGWRAVIADGFTKKNVQLVAQAIANMMTTEEIVIGYDKRFLSDVSAKWAAEVFAGNNIKVLFSNKETPTPMTMFTVKEKNLEYGLAITASHNPAIYNGIKVFIEGGRDADEVVTKKIENEIKTITTIRQIDFDDAVNDQLIHLFDPSNDYIDSILEKTNAQAIRDANLKILVDPMFGVSKTSLTIILSSLRCDVSLINDEHDTLFGGRLPSPSSYNLHEMSEIVAQNHYNLGIATDGDADRIGIVDENGKFIHPNMLIALLYYYLLEFKNETGAVVRNLSTTHLLDRIARDYGEKAIETPVGFKYISHQMEKHDALIGGESSGGLTIRGHINGKDGIFAATLIVEMISVTEKSLGQLVAELEGKYGKLYLVEKNYDFTPQIKKEVNEVLFVKKELPSFKLNVERVSYEDGLKVYFDDDAWISARFSGTEPLMRIFTEGNSLEEVKDLTDCLEDFLDIKQYAQY